MPTADALAADAHLVVARAVAGALAAPAELQRLRGSGATVLVEVVEGGAGASWR